jgi:hypothetical protein
VAGRDPTVADQSSRDVKLVRAGASPSAKRHQNRSGRRRIPAPAREKLLASACYRAGKAREMKLRLTRHRARPPPRRRGGGLVGNQGQAVQARVALHAAAVGPERDADKEGERDSLTCDLEECWGEAEPRFPLSSSVATGESIEVGT